MHLPLSQAQIILIQNDKLECMSDAEKLPLEPDRQQSEPNACFTYLLECADGTLYAGWTTDIERRVEQHNLGKGAKYTRARLPVVLRAVWQFDTRNEAMRFEWALKRMPRSRKLSLSSQIAFTEPDDPTLP